MKTLILTLTVLLATGCATYSAPPEAVAVMPNDCANKQAIESYLIKQVEANPGLMSEEDYETKKSYYKRALWQLRYNCNPSS